MSLTKRQTAVLQWFQAGATATCGYYDRTAKIRQSGHGVRRVQVRVLDALVTAGHLTQTTRLTPKYGFQELHYSLTAQCTDL